MSKPLTKRERLTRQARGQEIDRVPSLAGWIGGVRVLAELAGISPDAYLADPLAGVAVEKRPCNLWLIGSNLDRLTLCLLYCCSTLVERRTTMSPSDF